MQGVEIDMIVSDCLKALALYESIFDTKRVEATTLEKGENEAVLIMYGTRFHLLDENVQYQMMAPKMGQVRPMWVNITVDDIRTTYKKAMDAGCFEVQPVMEIPGFGVLNAMFSDPFGYLWMLHEITEQVSFEDRCRIMEGTIPQ